MSHPARFSQDEIEHGGSADVHRYNVEVTFLDGLIENIPVSACDVVDAINLAFRYLFPDWGEKKPASDISINVTEVSR